MSLTSWMDFQVVSAIVFAVVLGLLCIIYRKRLSVQGAFPFFYLIMYRTKVGISWMDRVAKKYRPLVVLFGYIAVGIGFVGMGLVFFTLIQMLVQAATKPAVVESGISFVLPFMSVPGIGYLTFWNWILAILILAVVHEAAHGIVARAYGMQVKSTGLAIFAIVAPFIPAAFVEPDEKKLQKEKDIVQYSLFAAGPVANLALALVVFLLLSFVLVPLGESMSTPAGVTMDVINESYPSYAAGMGNGTLISFVDGVEVKHGDAFIAALTSLRAGENVSIGNENTTYTLTAIASPDGKRGMIGVTNFRDYRVVKPGFGVWYGGYEALRESLRWLWILNLLVGFANFMPLWIVDGGRMLQTALRSVIADQKKADRVWHMVGTATLALIVLGLVIQYAGNPFI
ncbi:site-2 protease family protein [Candidatus Woesearchaeota archaeon]|nr:site-2 protease family protein [Candidatus Woesearchaeota archaeon]